MRTVSATERGGGGREAASVAPGSPLAIKETR